MTLIDQRILIDAPTDIVWKVVADPSHLASWHAGYKGVSVLTTYTAGVGSRRRCTLNTGKDVIEEITAWLEGLGYEYAVIEGGPFRKFQGRIRLQAGPDGTSVQWTVSYQPKGVMGGFKDRISGRRAMMALMAASLRQLRREVDALGARMTELDREKVAIRGRLNADERAQYQRRYAPPEGVVVPVQQEIVPVETTPSFVAELTGSAEESDYSHTADTKPKPPAGLHEAIAEAEKIEPVEEKVVPTEDLPFVRPPDEITPPPEVVPPAPEPEAPPAPVELVQDTPSHGMPAVEIETPPSVPDSMKQTPPRGLAPSDLQDPHLPPPTPKTDTGEISIWEAFGLKRPSEQDQAVIDDLMRSVKLRTLEAQRIGGRFSKRPARVRHLTIVLGLRLRLALQEVRVRLHSSGESESE